MTAPSDGELTLYINGASDLSATAIAKATTLCDEDLGGRYHLSIVDVRKDPAAVLHSHVIATPTLIRNLPAPERRLVGDLSDTDKVIKVLELPVARTASEALG